MTLVLSSAQKATAAAINADLAKFGWPHAAVCALLACAVGESSLNPNAVGDHDHSFGLWQIQAVAGVLRDTGVDLAHKASPADQCKALNYLLRHSEHKAGDALLSATSVQSATVAAVDLFERPADKLAAVAKRVPYAEFFDAMFRDLAA